MMRSKIEFLPIRGFKAPGFDEELSTRKRSIWRDLQVIYRSLGTLAGYWRIVLTVIAIGILYSTVYVMVPFIDKMLFDDVLPGKNWEMFWTIVALHAVVYIIGDSGIIGYMKQAIGLNVSMKLGMWMQVNFYRHIQKLSLQRVERKGVGDFMFRLHRDAADVTMVAWGTLSTWIGTLYTAILFVLFMAVFDPFLLAIVLTYEAVNLIAWTIFAGVWQKWEFRLKQAKTYADARMQEGFAGIETVKAFGRVRAETGSYLHRIAMQQRVDVMLKLLIILRQVLMRHSGIFPYWRTAGITLFLYWRIIHGETTYGTVVAILMYLKEMEKPIEALINAWFYLRVNVVKLDRFFQIWETPVGTKEPEHATAVPELKGDIDISHINYAYDNGVQVLFDVNLHIQPGEFVAIVGPSGSGKSTLLNLMLRLDDPSSGKIAMDGIDIRNFNSSRYQLKVGTVLQETFLSKETLRWNLLLGNYEATDEEMVEALTECRLKNWYDKLPDGLDSFLNEGTKVSGGEKQRLGVVRAILRNSGVFFLDEPTSALDLETEAEVMEVIERVRAKKTTVMVTHRLNTIRHADRIIVMDNGRIIEEGTHDVLMAKQGRYYQLLMLYQHSESPVAAQ